MNTTVITRHVSRAVHLMTARQAIMEFCSRIPTTNHSNNILCRLSEVTAKTEAIDDVANLVSKAAEGKPPQVIWFPPHNNTLVLQYRNHGICYRLRIHFRNGSYTKKVVFVVASNNPSDLEATISSGTLGFTAPIECTFTPRKFANQNQTQPTMDHGSLKIEPQQVAKLKPVTKPNQHNNGPGRFPKEKYAPPQGDDSRFEELLRVIGNIPMGEFLEFVAARNKH